MRVKNKTKTRLALPHFIWSQIGAFCLSAAASGCMFVRWWRLDEEGRQCVWWLYGVFTAFMCVGSVIGAAAWCFQTLTIASFFIFSKNPLHSSQSNQLSSLATIQTYSALFLFLYPLEVFCLSTVKLAVLDRMQDFCAAPGCARDKHMWRTAARAAMALVSAGCVVGLFRDIAAGVYRLQAAGFFADAAASAANNASCADLAQQASQRIQLAVEVQSVQNFAEMATLLLIVAVFVFVGVMCARRISSSLELTTGSAHAAIVDKAKHLRRQIFSTAAVVFVTFLLRAAFESFNAVSSKSKRTGLPRAMQRQQHPRVPVSLQPLRSHAAVSVLHARVSNDCRAHLVPPGAAGCLVEHDQRPNAAGFGAQQADHAAHAAGRGVIAAAALPLRHHHLLHHLLLCTYTSAPAAACVR